MICSSLFPFDESSWNPKELREILCIPEDQLNILINLPDWSKDDSSSVHGISKQSAILNSQSSQLDSQIPPTRLRENQHLSFKHIDLFNKDLEYRRKILGTETGNKRRHKSSSAIEIGKCNKALQESGLKRTFSIPDILLEIGSLLPKQPYKESSVLSKEVLLKKIYTLSNISKKSCKEIFSNSVRDSVKTLDNNNQFILKDKRNKDLHSNLKISGDIMEVIAQIPVNISCAEKNINDGVRFDVTIEKQGIVSTTHVASEIFCNSSSEKQIAANDKMIECTYSLNAENRAKNVESNASVCDDIESVSVIQPKLAENNAYKDNLETNLNVQKVVEESDNRISGETADISIEVAKTSENLSMDNALSKIDSVHNSSNVNIQEIKKSDQDIGIPNIFAEKPMTENQETNLNAEKVVEESNNDMPSKVMDISREVVEISETLPKEQTMSKNSSVHNASNNENSYVVSVEETQKSHQDMDISSISFEKREIVEGAITVKRKSESKKNSKKRKSSHEKKDHDSRSIKRAGEIAYSIEEIKTMLDLVKQFL